MTPGEIIGAHSLGKRFGAVEALGEVSFSLGGPSLIGVLGPNGAGKTTLLDLLAGLSEPTSGTLRLFGADRVRARDYPRRRVGVVLQQEFVLDRMTTREYAALFAAIYRLPRDAGDGRILAEAELQERADVPVERLSGGEAQRLFIAAAVAHRPDLLLLDEPTAHLDPQSKARIGAWLKRLSASCTVVLATHDLREADALCDQLLFLVHGRVRACGSREELVRAAPSRSGLGVEDAFSHYCAARLTPDGGLW